MLLLTHIRFRYASETGLFRAARSELCRIPFAFRYQFEQALFCVLVPSFLTDFVTFDRGDQADVSELDLRRIALLCNFKIHLGVLPLFFIAKPVKVAVENLPDDLLIGNHVNYFERDEGLSEPDGKNVVQFFGVSLEIRRPPVGHAIDTVECISRADVCGDSDGVILIVHGLFLSRDCLFYLSHVRAFSGPLIKREVLVDSD